MRACVGEETCVRPSVFRDQEGPVDLELAGGGGAGPQSLGLGQLATVAPAALPLVVARQSLRRSANTRDGVLLTEQRDQAETRSAIAKAPGLETRCQRHGCPSRVRVRERVSTKECA
jgi:hypothetical protein